VATSDIFFIIASVSIVIVVAALLPVLYQLKRTAEKAEIAWEKINKDLEPFLHKATVVSEELCSLSASLHEKIEKTDRIIDTVRLAGDTLLSTADLVKDAVTPVTVQLRGISAGIAAFTGFFKKTEHQTRR
jgi:uncharacterized protein YoxC